MRFSPDRRSSRLRRLQDTVKGKSKPAPVSGSPKLVPAPPAEPKTLSAEAESNLLEAASRVFARKGIAHTTLKDIAHAAEMDQDALTRAFRWKEAILERLLARPLEKSVAELRRIERTDLSPAAKLYRAVFFDAMLSGNAPEELKAVFRLPEARQAEFVSVAKLRTERLGTYERILEQGLDRGDFRAVHSGFTASLLDGLIHTALSTSSDYDSILPAAQANRIAEFAMRGLMNSPRRVQAIREEAGVL